MEEIKYCPVCGKDILGAGDICIECSSEIPTATTNPNNIKYAVLENKWSIMIVCFIVTVCLIVVGSSLNSDSTYVTQTVDIAEQPTQNEEPIRESNYSEEFSYDIACQRRLTYDDIRGLSKQELRIMRNWIFARHGYIFNSADLKEFFSKQQWYTPRSTNVISEFSDIEEYNVNFIKSYE